MSSEEAHQAWVPCSAGVPSPACSPRGRARDLAGFLATHPKPLPCSKTPAELTRPRPYRPCQHRPPGKPNRRPQRGHNLEANTGLQLPLSTLHERRHRLPCKTCLRLAGCASTGRVSNPLGRFERFQVTSILLSRTSPVARLAHINELPGKVDKIIAALGFLSNTRRISSAINVANRIFDAGASIFCLFCVRL